MCVLFTRRDENESVIGELLSRTASPAYVYMLMYLGIFEGVFIMHILWHMMRVFYCGILANIRVL